jgi:ssDNA thymidine ADP-ribosyltransferase, DarT
VPTPCAAPCAPQSFQERLEEECKARGIERLYHFTFAKNVRRIFTMGLIPRAHQHAHLVEEARVADPERRDPFLDGSCISVGFPAYRMFYRRMREHPEEDWVVLELGPEVMWTVHCAFFSTNASAACYSVVDKTKRRSVEAFAEMFADVARGRSRASLPIEAWMPTDPQAEVIAFGTVHTHHFRAVHFRSEAALQSVRSRLRPKHHHLLCVNAYPFGPRADHASWRDAG